MGKIKLKRIGIAAVIAALLIWSLIQTVGALSGGTRSNTDAVRLLYQVSDIHVELLGSLLRQAGEAKSGAELEPLKQALYTTTYTHDRLVQAVGQDRLPPLHSLTELSQLMLRLQLGGSRPVKPEEAKLMQEMAAIFSKIEMSYGKLMSSGGSIVASQSKLMAEADGELEKLLKK